MSERKEATKIIMKACLGHGREYAKAIKKNYEGEGVNAEEVRIVSTVTLAAICAEILNRDELEKFKGQIIEIMDGRLQKYLGVANQ